jgi:putative PIN family toxin of toxin-antitoxin system
MRITLDTNVLISGTFWTGDSFRILDMIDNKELNNVSSREIIEEYNETIKSDEIVDKVDNKKLTMTKIVHNVIKNSEIVEPTTRLDVIKDDPDDNRVLECAKEGKVSHVITNDNHLLKLKKFEGIKIVTPEEFLKILITINTPN